MFPVSVSRFDRMNDFEGWNCGKITTCGEHQFCGGYCVKGKGSDITKTFYLPPGIYSVELDFIKIDSWDREDAYVSVNGKTCWTKTNILGTGGTQQYDLREETVPKTGVKGFGQVFRFPSKQIFFGENFKTVPGPCRYRKDHDSMRKATTRKRRGSIKPNRSFGSSSTRAGHNSYLIKPQYSSSVGPGAYSSSRNTMIKKSFNVAAGHVSRSKTKNTRRKGPKRRFVSSPPRRRDFRLNM